MIIAIQQSYQLYQDKSLFSIVEAVRVQTNQAKQYERTIFYESKTYRIVRTIAENLTRETFADSYMPIFGINGREIV